MSRLMYAGPVNSPWRSTLPHVLGAAAEKTDVSNHRLFEPIPPSTAGVPVAFGVCVLPLAFRLALLAVKSIGVPEIAEKTPVICQSPSTLPTVPSLSQCPSGPHGSRYTKLLLKLCVESNVVRCQPRSGAAGVEMVGPPSPVE